MWGRNCTWENEEMTNIAIEKTSTNEICGESLDWLSWEAAGTSSSNQMTVANFHGPQMSSNEEITRQLPSDKIIFKE